MMRPFWLEVRVSGISPIIRPKHRHDKGFGPYSVCGIRDCLWRPGGLVRLSGGLVRPGPISAWLRHQTTAYDWMAIPRIKGKRREVRRMLARRSQELLARYRLGVTVQRFLRLQTTENTAFLGRATIPLWCFGAIIMFVDTRGSRNQPCF
jgi:Uncharacterized conserved protein (DUF2293)